jgi:hypothetical protein
MHAGSLEALRVTRPEAVVSLSNDGGLSRKSEARVRYAVKRLLTDFVEMMTPNHTLRRIAFGSR